MAKSKQSDRFGIEQLFGSKTRSRLLQVFLTAPQQPFYVRELTRKIEAQLNSVRREIQHLLELGLIEEVEPSDDPKARKDRKKYYRANLLFPLFEELRALFTKVSVLVQQDMVRSIIEGQSVQVLILTGMFVGAGNVETDMLIVGSPDPKELQKRILGFEAMLGKEVNYTVMPTDEYLYRKDISDRFLLSIIDGQNIVIHNELP